MKVGSYVKVPGSFGTVVGTAVVEGVGVIDVRLYNDSETTEFLELEVTKIRFPKSSKFKGLAARILTDRPNPTDPGFVPVPEAGIFTSEDWRELDARYEQSRQVFNRGGLERPTRRQAERITLASMSFGKRGGRL